MAATTKKEKCRNAGRAVCTFLVTCFCGLIVLTVVEFISEDLNFVAKKKKFSIFSLPSNAETITSSLCTCPPLLSRCACLVLWLRLQPHGLPPPGQAGRAEEATPAPMGAVWGPPVLGPGLDSSILLRPPREEPCAETMGTWQPWDTGHRLSPCARLVTCPGTPYTCGPQTRFPVLLLPGGGGGGGSRFLARQLRIPKSETFQATRVHILGVTPDTLLPSCPGCSCHCSEVPGSQDKAARRGRHHPGSGGWGSRRPMSGA